MKISSKAQFYAMWDAGLLGNKPRTWTSYVEASRAGLDRYSLREVGKAGGGNFIIVTRGKLAIETADWEYEGRRYNIGEVVPSERATLQGEVCCTYNGWHGFMGVTPGKFMREAAAEGLFHDYGGAATRCLLRTFMDGSSLDDLDLLMEIYPDATVEFTCYNQEIGIIPHRNTIMWEVRDGY